MEPFSRRKLYNKNTKYIRSIDGGLKSLIVFMLVRILRKIDESSERTFMYNYVAQRQHVMHCLIRKFMDERYWQSRYARYHTYRYFVEEAIPRQLLDTMRLYYRDRSRHMDECTMKIVEHYFQITMSYLFTNVDLKKELEQYRHINLNIYEEIKNVL